MHSKPAPFLCITASLQTVFQLHEFIVSSQRKKVSPLLSNGKVQRNLNHTKGSIDIYIYLNWLPNLMYALLLVHVHTLEREYIESNGSFTSVVVEARWWGQTLHVLCFHHLSFDISFSIHTTQVLGSREKRCFSSEPLSTLPDIVYCMFL